MIVDNGKYYLYRHIRSDKNQPFYIGVGTKPRSFNSKIVEYRRAFHYTTTSRGGLWNSIVSKTDYYVEILLESNDYDFILKKEKEWICLYGRISNHTGFLSNISEGGRGAVGYNQSQEHRNKISESNKKHPKHQPGNKLPPETIEKMKMAWAGKKVSREIIDKATEAKKKKVKCVTDGCVFNSVMEAAKFAGVAAQYFCTKLKRGQSIKNKIYEYVNMERSI